MAKIEQKLMTRGEKCPQWWKMDIDASFFLYRHHPSLIRVVLKHRGLCFVPMHVLYIVGVKKHPLGSYIRGRLGGWLVVFALGSVF